ncbi:aspartic protease, putative [Rhizoctonia solani AG-3 Rhs1AP]|uniref:Aspartic protease, putative n=2 Tax=Rhizoctonia solani AG-3 TaxID=1086053 RepID=X8JUS7_9AGAM|nr:aspartic protease, putative [Rhizoctonia solani AG-3 Rhs1AP]
MEFGVALSTDKPSPIYDGVLGLGIRMPNNVQYMPTIMDTLVAQRAIQQNVFGLSFEPTTPQGPVIGELTFGVYDILMCPCRHWSFEQFIQYGNQLLQPLSIGALDSGATLIYISHQAFEVYSRSLQGSRVAGCELLEIPQTSLSKMKSLYFHINDVSYEFTREAQLWPQRLNHLVRGRADRHYSVINTIAGFASPGVSLPDVIFGYTFMKRFYTAYDRNDLMVGFAYTPSTYANVY